ncbi:metal ion transporter [Apiospora kogelbergensis]|uniref:metal ion transporter n=1 Tax=Apiospora kogelbergensis TaxID=1337665 RepID=UPI00312EEC27
MSDHEEISERGSGYDTPVPELDDHRHQSASVQRPDRPRRGTVDTLYGTRHLETPPDIRVRDFEEAIADDDADDMSPIQPRSRRPTVDTVNDGRSLSPPNSVKAFAEARRRGRAYSNNKDAEDAKEDGERLHLARTFTGGSRQSVRSVRSKHTVADDAASLGTNRTAEEDVCFPMNDEHRQDRLYIDFDYLENFIAAENAARKEEIEAANATKVFPALQTEQFRSPSPMVTADGDIYHLPPETSVVDEKQVEETALKSDAEAPKQDPIDPNRFSFFSTAWESTIHAAEFGDLVLPGENVRGLFEFPADMNDGVWWLNMNSPTEEEVRTICKAFGVHPLTIEDITTQEAREKIELFPSYYFACFRSFSVTQEEDGPDYEPFNLYVIVFREGTLSFSFEPNSHASLVRKRITMLKEYVSLSSDWICYALIDNIVDSFAPAIHRIELITEGIEDSVFVARADDMHSFLRRIGAVRKNTLGLMRILGGKADVLKGFTKRCNENYKVTPRMDIGMYLGDIQDHVVTMMTNLTHFEKILSRAHSNYLAQLTIDSIAQGTKTNEVLSKITFLASVIVPLNVVTGLFGMNVHVPWQDIDNLHAFIAILCSLVGFVLIALLIARKAKYI